MTARIPDHSMAKAAISVAEMARLVGLSVNHFRSLCKRGVFPKPQYTTTGRPRPYFDIEAQQVCLNVRQSNIGNDGAYVIFYDRKKADTPQTSPIGKKAKPSDRAEGLAKAIKQLGLVVTGQQVEDAAVVVFPQGLPAEDGQAIRALFVHLKKSLSG